MPNENWSPMSLRSTDFCSSRFSFSSANLLLCSSSTCFSRFKALACNTKSVERSSSTRNAVTRFVDSRRTASTLRLATSLSDLAASQNSRHNPTMRTIADNFPNRASGPLISLQSEMTSPAAPRRTSRIPGWFIRNAAQLRSGDNTEIIMRRKKEDKVAHYIVLCALGVLLVSKILRLLIKRK